MEERNLNDAIKKAESLRSFRDVNKERFEKNTDHVDIVLLADEVQGLRTIVAIAAPTALIPVRETLRVEDDHTESW